MPTYKVTDPNTGKKLRVTGDSPPTEQELDEIFASQGEPQNPAAPISKGESLLGGVKQGTTFSFADELGGAAGAVTSKVADVIGQNPYGKSLKDYYQEERDIDRSKYAAERAANPKSFLVGELIGGVLTSFVPGLGPAKAAQGVKAANTAKMAALGAAQGLGSSEADLTEGDVLGAAKDSAKGAALGAVLSKGMDVVGSGVDKFRTALPGIASKAGQVATGFTKRFLGDSKSRLKISDSVMKGIEKGVIKASRDPDEMMQAANAVADEAGSTIGSFLKKQNGTPFNPQEAAAEIASIKPQATGGTWDEKANAVQEAIDTVLGYGDKPVTWEMANAIKGELQSLTKYDSTKSNAVNEIRKATAAKFREYLDRKLEEMASASGNQVDFDKFMDAKKTWGAMQTLKDGLDNAISSSQGNKAIGLTDWIGMGSAGIAGAAAAGPIGALAGPALYGVKKVAEKYGPQAVAVGASRIDDVLKNNPQILGKYAPILRNAVQRGAQALASNHFVLWENDPKYREQLRQLDESPQ